MSRPSISDAPMTGAERQARYRAARADGVPVVRVRRPADRRSRIQRWRDAVSTLMNLQVEYATWLEALPDNQRDGTTAAPPPKRTRDYRARSLGASDDRTTTGFRPRLTNQIARPARPARATRTRGGVIGHSRSPPEPRVDARVQELTEMTIGRIDDPESPLEPGASRPLDCLGPDRGFHLGQRSRCRVGRPNT
jgi:hypothetical protein